MQFLRRIKRKLTNFIDHRLDKDFRRIHAAYKKNVIFTKEAKFGDHILLLNLEGMNHFMAVLWGVYASGLRAYGYKFHAVSQKNSLSNNRLLRMFHIPIVYLEDVPIEKKEIETSKKINREISSIRKIPELIRYFHKELPLGKFAISTWCRNNMSGDVELDMEVTRKELGLIGENTFLSFVRAKKIINRFNSQKIFSTELNTDSYAGFYLAALDKDLDIVRWASSGRDDSYFLQHLGRNFKAWHHSALSQASWSSIKSKTFHNENELQEFFNKRYGGEWKVFSRNYAGTHDYSVDDVRASLNVGRSDVLAIIFSHILYDTLYFYGEDLFDTYVEWLIETIKTAIENPGVTWAIKLHPSNIWRGENRDPEKYEEIRLIEKYIGPLPSHIKLILPDTKISPLSWMRAADIGVTVRGTAGLEMAAMGKKVITAGTGRYDRSGFTFDPNTREEYVQMLQEIASLPSPTDEEITIARQYMHSVFVKKAFKVTSLDVELVAGKKDLVLYNDMILLPSEAILGKKPMEWEDLQKFSKWLSDRGQLDYICK